MSSRPFANADPFLKFLVLFLLSFMGVGVFMLMANGLVNALWGISFFSDPTLIQDYANPQIVQINRVLLLFQHLGMFIIPSVIFAMLVSKSWVKYLGFKRPDLKVAIAGALIMISSLPLINALSWLNQLVQFPESLAGIEQVFVGMEESAAELTKAITETDSLSILIFNLLLVAIIPALGEEMIFRGLVLPIFKKWTGKLHLAVWLSALLFSAMHMQFFGFLPRLVLGAVLGYLYVWSRSLWVPILAHFTNNALALILIFYMAKGDISKEVDEFNPGATDLIWLVISLVVLGGLFGYIYRKYAKGMP
jgi:membrane protease YdiL (CAAX protease family)